jgi:hypothetical protein
MNTPCAKKRTLLLKWQAATEVYSAAVGELARNVGGAEGEKFDRLKRRTELARHRTIQARSDFEGHVEDHGC